MDHNDDRSNGTSEKQSLPSDASYAYGLYGPLENLSRVGDEYQTEIPSMITESEYLDYTKNPIEEQMNAGIPSEFLIGLAIPIVWITQEVGNILSDSNDVKIEAKFQPCLVPGHFVESWSEIERATFLLGLYIFEKDFVQLKRFIESKKMGDILSYYYGPFYRSDEYGRWSESRKSRGKRCILGQRIFTGLRLQEFLARLFSDVSQECQNSLLEVSRSFVDGRISLKHYVFSLKTTIGIQTFVDTVAIGTGKQDLTGNAIEPTKQNQAIHIRPEIPTGKACSSLTSTEIVKFLTGDYRLSKARSNDLFWEAVWPRLLARGWHSEQPNGYNYALNGKHSLVFLIPGVKKFSRRLIKGDAYFDSVTDVLNKVASDPQILELENEENGEKTELQEDEQDGFLEKRKSHCYLQPRAPNRSSGLTKFTIVDTSSSGNIIKLRELNPLNLTSRSRSRSYEIHSDLVSSNESDSANTLLVEQETSRKPVKKQKTCDTRKPTKGNLSRKSRQENSNHNAKRRRRLTACSRVQNINIDDLTENTYSHVGSSSQANNNNNNKLSSNLSFSSRCSSIDTVEEQQEPNSINLIDLNYPQIIPEFENSESVTEIEKPMEQDNNNGVLRRQSTRNRPPTARALEALANGFLTINSRKKGKYDISRDSGSRSRSSRYYRGEIGGISECSTGDACSTVKGDDETGACSTVKGDDETGACNGEIEK